MNFCLPKDSTEKFLNALREGKIDPEKMAVMSSAERRAVFDSIIGKEYSKPVNASFEKTLLLKNQQRGMVNWAKQVGGIREPVRRDMIARIEKMDRILTAADEKTFLNDLAEKKLGVEVSFDEASEISTASRELARAKERIDSGEPAGGPTRIEYGARLVELQNLVNNLKAKQSETTFSSLAKEFKTSPGQATIGSVSKMAGFAKGLKASLDNSAIFRQGWRTIFTNPTIWARNAAKSFSDIARQLKRKPSSTEVIDGVKADIYSRQNALDGHYKRMKLDIGTGEEAFPTSLPAKIPGLGRLYTASQTAYEGFLYRMRADIADKFIDIAKANNVNLADPFQARSIGRMINSLTGRGDLGSFEKVGKQINTIFFSPKAVKSHFDFLTLHATDKMSTFARKQAAINMVKVIGGMATILLVAKTLDPDSVEFDPRSSDFGKIKIKDTRFDMSGGMSSMMVLASRLATLETKSTATGKVTPLNSGKFGSKTGLDVTFDFFTNKTSPFASIIVDLLRGRDFDGNKPTPLNEAKNLLVPLPITNNYEALTNPDSANDLLIMIADGLGISTNTYTKKKK